MRQINWNKLPLGEWTSDVAKWSDADRELAGAAVNLSRALYAMLPPKKKQQLGVLNPDPFVKIPDLADGVALAITGAIWYGSAELQAHVREVIATALLIDLMGLIP